MLPSLALLLLFVFHYLQAFDHFEREAHHASFLALMLEIDGIIVVVDEHLGEEAASVVEPLGPLRDGIVLNPACLVAHLYMLLSTRSAGYSKDATLFQRELEDLDILRSSILSMADRERAKDTLNFQRYCIWGIRRHPTGL